MTSDPSRSDAGRLIGREHELGRLRQLVAAPPPGSVITVSGEAGIGKSALVNQVIAECLAAGGRVVRGSADERVTARFSMWRRAMRDLGVAVPHADPTVTASDQVDEVAAAIGDGVLGGEWRFMLLEDIHWADDSSVEVAQLLADRLNGRGIAIVATARPGEPRAPALSGLQRQGQSILLSGLTPEHIQVMALQHTGETLTSAEAGALHRRTGGNPLFVGELLGSEHSRLSTASGSLLSDALDGLGANTADVLGAIAIAGRAAPPAVVAHALSISTDELENHVRRALDAHIFATGSDCVYFRHDLLVDAAAGRLAPATRRAVHRSLADGWATYANLDDDGLERARHVVSSTASNPSCEEVDVVLQTAFALRRKRRAGDAADLVELALRVWETAPPPLSMELWMALGEARWDLAERPAALACFDRAAATGAEADVATEATIEIARQRNHNPFVADPIARRRLADLDLRLAGDDSALRVALLGRRAVLALQPPADLGAATELADTAVAMARRLGDRDVLLTALCDRGFIVTNADDVRRRGNVASELLELARKSGRPHSGVAGYEWHFDDCLTRGDLGAATRALHEFEAAACVAPSAFWRYSSSLRRAVLLLAEGDRDGAIDAIATLVEVSQRRVDRFELLGVELSIRAPAMILFGIPDPRVAVLQAGMAAMFDRAPSGYMQVRLAVGELLIGDPAAARRRATHWLGEPESAFEAPDPLGTLALMAFLAAELQIPEPVTAIARSLRKFTGLLASDIGLPVDLLLSRLAALGSNPADAIVDAQSSLEFARSMPSAVIEMHCLRAIAEAQQASGNSTAAAAANAAAAGIAERSGVVAHPAWSRQAVTRVSTTHASAGTPSSAHRQGTLSRAGDIWQFRVGPESASVLHLTGLEQIARLLRSPGIEIAADDLNGTQPSPDNDLGPALDTRAKREYRQRINDIRADIAEAEQWADPERVETARRELDALIAELRRAVGLGGRDRPQGSGSERARINVARNIRRAIATIERSAPELAAHLTVSIRTGHHCVYAPEPAARIDWTINAF